VYRILDAKTFFDSSPPGGIPEDAPPPDLKRLASAAESLVPSSYPWETMKEILARENRRLGAGKASLESIDSIDGDTVFVVGGQQAGLFGGPLYTLYKAMHAVRLAERLAGETGRNVVPVFWVASDDHDFEEVGRLGVRSGDGTVVTVDYSPENRIDGAPLAEVVLDDGISDAIGRLARFLPPGESSERHIDVLRGSWAAGRTWTEAFAVQMLKVFEPHGLVVLDPCWKRVKELFRTVYSREISEPLASTLLVNERAGSMERTHGRGRVLRKPENSTNLFITLDGRRRPLVFEPPLFAAGGRTFRKEELEDIIENEPHRISPAAALRPVCQDAVLPVAALIAGPGERVYLEQLDTVYSRFGVAKSLVWPRASFTVIDARILRTAEKEGVALPLLFEDIDRIRNSLAKSSFPGEIEEDIDSLEEAVESRLARTAGFIAGMDPSLEGFVHREKGKILHSIRRIRERALRAHKASLDLAVRRLSAASYFLRPRGGPQERWFGMDAVAAFLHGGGFDELLKLTSPGEERHRMVMPGE